MVAPLLAWMIRELPGQVLFPLQRKRTKFAAQLRRYRIGGIAKYDDRKRSAWKALIETREVAMLQIHLKPHNRTGRFSGSILCDLKCMISHGRLDLCLF
jgi:hypothetical protein